MTISQISRPGPGQTITIHAAVSDKIILGFSTESIALSRDNGTLVFTFDDGAAIRLDDFYDNYHAGNIPDFEAADKLFSGTEFFSALGPDLIPAAGPAPVERSHSAQEYGDSDLLGGVDHLDGLVTSGEEKSAAMGGDIQFDSTLAARGADFGGNPGSAGPEGPSFTPPLFPSGPFARAVLYSSGNPADPVTTNVFFGGNGVAPAAVSPGDIDFAGSAPGAKYAVAVSLPAGWSSSWVDVSFDSVAGRLEFRLTADGVDEMQRLGLAGENLVDFVHVTVTDRTSGDTFEYNVEFVATDSQIFDSAAHDSLYGGQHLDNIGEFHQGQNNGGAYSVISSAQNDEIIINEAVLGGSSIHASGSADPAHMADDYNAINLNAGVVNTTQGSVTHITSADGALDVVDGVTAQGSGAENVIHMGKGSVYVQHASGDGVSAADGGKNAVSGGDVTVSGRIYGMTSTNSGSNNINITTASGNADVAGVALGMSAASFGGNSINADSGEVRVSSNVWGMNASSFGGNSINTKSGDVRVSGNYHGMEASSSGSNSIKTDLGNVSVSSNTASICASSSGSNSIETEGGNVAVAAVGSYGVGMYADLTGKNTIDAKDGNVAVTATGTINGHSMYAANAGSSNSIKTTGGTVEISATSTSTGGSSGFGFGMRADDSGSNSIKTDSGDVRVSASSGYGNSYGVTGTSSGSNTIEISSNSIETSSGNVTIVSYDTSNGTNYGTHYGTFTSGSSTSINTKGGNVSISGSGKEAYGVHSQSGGNFSIATTSGNVTVSGTGPSFGIGVLATGATNTIETENGAVSVSGSTKGLYATSNGSNTITTKSSSLGGAVNVSGAYAMLADSIGSNEIETVAGNVTIAGVNYGMSTSSSGSNIITTSSGEVSVSGCGTDSGRGMSAVYHGVNTIKSAIGSPLTVTITASADVAEKAIAMWASDGGSVNRITGHSVAGGTGDSVTLTANNGQGIAMQTANGGTNIITTGAGDDSVTIKGKIIGDGNKIDLGGGSNTLTLNGAVQPGSLNVIATGGTYTLILQESGVESFADRYGDWLDDIVTNNLFSGLSNIHFEGWDEGGQSAEELAAFMATFGDTLNTLHDAGVAIEPQALSDYLANPGSASSPAPLLVETGVEHHAQDAQAAQDAQHAATGHDASTQETALAAHDGSGLVTGDGSEEATFNAQADTTALQAGILVPDDSAQPCLVAGEHEVEPAQPLFAFLNAPAGGTPTGMLADEGDASVHNGYLGSGESGSGNAGVQGEIALTLGDESLDSLLAGTDQQLAENGGHGLWYVESGSDLHEVPLTDMSEIIVQGGSGEHVSDAGVTTEEYAHLEQEAVSVPTVMDSNQETMDNAAREMATY